jgi:hypothetical protein
MEIYNDVCAFNNCYDVIDGSNGFQADIGNPINDIFANKAGIVLGNFDQKQPVKFTQNHFNVESVAKFNPVLISNACYDRDPNQFEIHGERFVIICDMLEGEVDSIKKEILKVNLSIEVKYAENHILSHIESCDFGIKHLSEYLTQKNITDRENVTKQLSELVSRRGFFRKMLDELHKTFKNIIMR